MKRLLPTILLTSALGSAGAATGPAPAIAPTSAPASTSTSTTPNAPASADEPHAAIVKNVTGTVRVIRATGPLELVAGMPLHASDRLVSERGASAGLAFRDGTLLTIGPSAQLELRQYVYDPNRAKYAFSVYLAKGSAIYESGKIGKAEPGAVRVETPNATVGVRGTRFLVTAEE